MNPLDIAILATMIFLVVRGVLRGFMREVASLAGIVLGIWLAIRFETQVSGYLRPHLPSNQYLPLISFGVLFTLILLCCNLLGWVLSLAFKKALLGWADRILGAVLAVTKGVIITYLAIVLLTFYLPSQAPLIAKSKLAHLVTKSYQRIISLISPDHYQNLKKRFLGNGKKAGELVARKQESEPER